MGSAKRSDQVAPDFARSGIESPQEWRLQNPSGHPIPLLDFKDCYCEKIFPSNPVLTLLATYAHCPPTMYHGEEHASISLLVILVSPGGLLFSKPISTSWTSPPPSAPAHWASAPVLVGFCWAHSGLLISCLAVMQIYRKTPNSFKRKNFQWKCL